MIDVKKLKNSEKIRMYRSNFDVDSDVRNKCKQELELLKESSKKPMQLPIKIFLIIVAILSVIFLFVKPILAVVGVVVIIATLIISASIRNSNLDYDENYQKQREEIYEKYNSIGYFPQISDDIMIRGNQVCGDYDESIECYVCSVDGHPISDWNYKHRCNNSVQCPHCKKRLSALAPDGFFLEYPPRPIDENIAQFFYDI